MSHSVVVLGSWSFISLGSRPGGLAGETPLTRPLDITLPRENGVLHCSGSWVDFYLDHVQLQSTKH